MHEKNIKDSRALAERDPFRINIMGGYIVKEKNYVLYISLLIYPPNLFTKLRLHWVLPVWKDWIIINKIKQKFIAY